MGLNNNLGRLTEVLTVSGSNVGVGLATPGVKLDVIGNIRAKYAANSSNISFQPDFGQVYIVASSADNTSGDKKMVLSSTGLSLRSMGSSTAAMEILSGGNVGIGTTTPTTKLDVQASGVAGWFTSATDAIPLSVINNGTTVSTVGFKGSTTTNQYVVRCGADGNDFITYTNNTEKLRITSGGLVGIGTTNPLSGLVVQKSTSGGRGGEISIVNFATNTTGNNAALNFGLEPSTYNGDDCNFQVKATLTGLSGASTDGVFSNWNGASFVETLRIKSTGTLSIPYGQIQFPASQNASSNPNTLDDYEEGTWSPQLAGTSGGYAGMSGITSGRYTKIGNKVTATAQIQWGSIVVSISGNVVLQGLPFASVTGGVRCCGSMGAIASGLTFPSGYGEWVYLIDPGFSSVYIIANSTTGAGYTHMPNVGSTGTVYSLTITYFTA